MHIAVAVVITLAFAVLGLFIAVRLVPDRSANRERFLMTALVCVALAVVLSGLVRRPVMKMLRGSASQQSIAEAISGNQLYGLVLEISPEAANSFLESARAMSEQVRAEDMELTLSDWDVTVILWEKLIPGGVGIAPDEAAAAFARGLEERLRTLAGEDPRLALAVLSPRAFPETAPRALALTGRFGDGVRAVVEGAFNDPGPLYDRTESARVFEAALAEFVAQRSRDGEPLPDLDAQLRALDDPEALRGADAGELPLLVADLLAFALDRPEPERAVIIKHIFSEP